MEKCPTQQHGEVPYTAAWRSALHNSMEKCPTPQHGEVPYTAAWRSALHGRSAIHNSILVNNSRNAV
jgi:hypothetical protein